MYFQSKMSIFMVNIQFSNILFLLSHFSTIAVLYHC